MPTTSKKKPRHHKPVKTKPQLVTLTREQCQAIAANFVARAVAGHFKALGKLHPALVQAYTSSLATAAAEWMDETGEEMPVGIDDVKVAARLAGWTAESAEAGNYTLAQVHRQLVATKRLRHHHHQSRELLAAEIVKSMAAHDPTALVDRYERAAKSMSSNARKSLVAMLVDNATMEADLTTGRDIMQRTGLEEWHVKAVFEHELKRVEAACGFTIVGAKRSRGRWLTPEGVEVAKRIDQKILPKKTTLTIG